MKTVRPTIQKITLAFTTALMLGLTVNAQNTAGKLEEQFNQYGKKVLQEKLFVHTDRNFYITGDILWLKLYNVDASFHQSLGISKVAYAEILDANNTPVLQTKIALEDGKGNGSIYLPVTLNSGNYKLRAYTNWMKNFGVDYFFEKIITLVNPQKKREIIPPVKQLPPDIRFFPEGGNLVYGIPSKIACKVLNPDGRGATFKGHIVDEQNNTVISFHSLDFGMGSFDFTPLARHRYQAVIETGKNRITKELPEIYKEGYVMHVSQNDKQAITVQVQTNIASGGEVYLLAHTRQSLKTVMKATLQNGLAVFSVDLDKLGDGISQLTVFNNDLQPVCERLHFTYPLQRLNISVNGNNKDYRTRSKIDLDIRSTDQSGKQLGADMSIAVYRVDALQLLDETNINTFLWLSSDLKGHIESPGYYFENITPEVVLAMDNLMLTQGWRRFGWDDVLQDKTPVLSFPPEYNGHIITGKVINSLTGAPIENIETYASVPGPGTHFLASKSDASGKVKFDFKKIKGSSEIIVQTNPPADSLTHVEIANPFYENYSSDRLPAFRLSKINESTLLDHSIGTQVQNIYTGDKLKQFTQNADTVAFFEKPDATYFLDDFTRFTTMEEVMREYVMFMDVQKRNGKFFIPLMYRLSLPLSVMIKEPFFETDPLILVDGVPVFDVNKLMNFDPRKMRKLEMVNKRYFLGNAIFPGIMNWKTYKGDLANYELDPHATVIDYEGLQLEREFYSPVYDTDEKVASHLPDFRNVLYWSPNIHTGEKGQQHVGFYTSDKKGSYVAVIQGLSANGSCGAGLWEFEVK